MTVGRRQFAHGSAFIRFLVWQKTGDNAIKSIVKICPKNDLLLCFALGSLLAQSANATPSVATLAELQTRIKEHLSQPRFAPALWGVKIVSLDSESSLHSDLIAYGRADPSLAARFNNGDYGKSMEVLVAALVTAGVKRIEGDLIGDESFFRGPPFGSSWTWDDLQNYYGAEVSALTQEDNVVDLVVKPGEQAGAPCLIVTQPEATLLDFFNRTETTARSGQPAIT